MTRDEHQFHELEQVDCALNESGIPYALHELKDHPKFAPEALKVIERQLGAMTSYPARYAVVGHIGKLNGAPDVLIHEFRRLRTIISQPDDDASHYGWDIGEELRTTVKERHVDAIIDLVQDRAYGVARQMLPYALARFKKRREGIIPVLTSLLDDEDVMGQVLDALGRLKAVESIPYIMPCLNHRHWSKEAQKVLAKLGVKIPQQADESALSSYRERGAAINLSGLTMITPTDDLEEMCFTIAAIVSEGFTYTDALNLIYRERDMEVEETDGFGFDVMFDGSIYPLYIEIFMDDVDVPTASCFTSKPLATKIQTLVAEGDE